MSAMEVAVGFRREPGTDVIIHVLRPVLVDLALYKILGNNFHLFVCHNPLLLYLSFTLLKYRRDFCESAG